MTLDQNQYERFLQLSELTETLEDVARDLAQLYGDNEAHGGADINALLDSFDELQNYIIADMENLDAN